MFDNNGDQHSKTIVLRQVYAAPEVLTGRYSSSVSTCLRLLSGVAPKCWVCVHEKEHARYRIRRAEELGEAEFPDIFLKPKRETFWCTSMYL